MAYVLLRALRRIGSHDTDLATATCGTIRLKLLKTGAIVRVSIRRINNPTLKSPRSCKSRVRYPG